MQGILADRLVRFSKEDGQEIKTVLGRIIRQFRAHNFRASGHQVGQADRLIGNAPRFHLARPADKHGYAVPSLPIVALHAPPGTGPVMLMGLAHIDDGGYLRPIVAGENDQGVVGKPVFFQGLRQFPHHMIHLEYKISMRPGIRLALEILAREGRQMNGLHGMKEKEGLVGLFLFVPLEELKALLEKDLIDFLQVEVRSDHARTVVPGVRVLGQRSTINDPGWRNGNAVAVDIGVQPIGSRTTCGAEEMIEPTIDRAAFQFLGIIDQAHGIQAVFVDRLAFLVKGSEPDVPFPEHRCLVPLLPEHSRQGQPFRGDQARSPHPGKDTLVI